MCKVLKVSRSGYYHWLEEKPSKRNLDNERICRKIRQIHSASREIYGSPRITNELRKEGIRISRPRVARLMRSEGIRSKIRRKFVATTDSKHHYPVVANLLERNFQADQPGRVWVSDITYIPTAEGWLYLTVVMDLADRAIIGWSHSKSLRAIPTSMAAFRMAVNNRPLTGALIFHSDRGIQYACTEFQDLLKAYPGVQRSMSRKGDCWDNAVAESFFKTLKVELVYGRKFYSRSQATLALFEYIEIWYNRKRQHSKLGYLSPEEYFNKMKLKLKAA